MTSRLLLCLCLTALLALPASANAQSAAERIASLESAVSKGLFLVLEDEGVNLAIIGRAPEGMGQGALRRLDVGRRGDLIVAAQTLRREHPASLDSLPRRALRIATPEGYCSARLGRVFVVDVGSRATLNTHREAPMEDADEAREVWMGGQYVAAVIERGCHGILATTTVTDSRTRGASHVPPPDLLAQAELAFAGSAAAREASISRVTVSADGGGFLVSHSFSLGEAHTLTFVSEVLPDIWHCSGAQDVFAMVLEQRGGVLRRVGVPRMDFEVGGGPMILDLDGDGALEIVVHYEGSTTLFELRTDQDQLVPLGGFGVSYEIGC